MNIDAIAILQFKHKNRRKQHRKIADDKKVIENETVVTPTNEIIFFKKQAILHLMKEDKPFRTYEPNKLSQSIDSFWEGIFDISYELAPILRALKIISMILFFPVWFPIFILAKLFVFLDYIVAYIPNKIYNAYLGWAKKYMVSQNRIAVSRQPLKLFYHLWNSGLEMPLLGIFIDLLAVFIYPFMFILTLPIIGLCTLLFMKPVKVTDIQTTHKLSSANFLLNPARIRSQPAKITQKMIDQIVEVTLAKKEYWIDKELIRRQIRRVEPQLTTIREETKRKIAPLKAQIKQAIKTEKILAKQIKKLKRQKKDLSMTLDVDFMNARSHKRDLINEYQETQKRIKMLREFLKMIRPIEKRIKKQLQRFHKRYPSKTLTSALIESTKNLEAQNPTKQSEKTTPLINQPPPAKKQTDPVLTQTDPEQTLNTKRG